MTDFSVAFVSQPFDSVIPPVHNSIGRIAHELARRLADDHPVRIYANAGVPGHAGLGVRHVAFGIEHRFVDGGAIDRLVPRLWPHLSDACGLLGAQHRPPLSTSAWMGGTFAHRVAHDLATDPVDVVQVQSASQYLPWLRAACPAAVLTLDVQAGWYRHMAPAKLARRVARADVVVACSRYVAGTITNLLPGAAGKVRVVYDGVDVAAARRRQEHAAARGSGGVILYVGAISAHKGVHDLIEAFVALARDRPDLRLRLVGPEGNYGMEEMFDLADPEVRRTVVPLYTGDYGRRLRSMIPLALADRVEVCGPASGDRLLDLYAAADVFVAPAIHEEGFGLPPVEAMASAVPIVATRSGAMTETISNGETGLLVDRGRPDQLAAALARVLDDEPLRRRLGDRAARVAADRFDWAVQARALETVFEEAIAERAALPLGSPGRRGGHAGPQHR